MTSQRSPIEVWPATARGQGSSVTHFWYRAPDSRYRRVCDDEGWPAGDPLVSSATGVYAPCAECRNLYVEDMARDQRLSTVSHVAPPTDAVLYSPQFGGYPREVEGIVPLDIGKVALATFARFSEASMSQRVRVVRDARIFRSDPKSYAQRDYYFDLRNTLRKTHWQGESGGLDAFEAAVDPMLQRQKVRGKAEHYKTVSEAYLDLWKKRDAQFFRIPARDVDLAGLAIHVTAEVGMRYDSNSLALKIVFAAPKPTRHFRQVIQFLSEEAYEGQPLQPLIWDVRRQDILPRVPTPRDFRLALEGDAMAFQQIWRSLDRE